MSVCPTWVQALSGAVSLLGCMFACSPAQAGSFTVNPIRVTLSNGHPVAALTVRNVGDTPAVIQLQGTRWSQRDGTDLYEDTPDILATPPVFTVPVGKTQLVRIGLRRAPDPGQELTYRLYLQEVPPPPVPGFKGLQMSLRMGVPIFVLPVAPVSSNLLWRARWIAPGKLSLSATNAGNVHIQIKQFQWRSASESSLAGTRQVSAYLLPGQLRAWVIETHQAPALGLHLIAQTDAGNVETDLAVGAQ